MIVDQIKHSPFLTEEFLKLVVQLEDRVDGDVHSEFYSVKNGLLSNKGSRDFVDYRPSLKLTSQLLDDLQCKIASLDSLHFSQIQEITDAFTNTSVKIVKGDQAVNLVLPETYDKYLIELPRKKRHELKRKKSRFESLHPNAVLKESKSDDVFDIFVELHKTSEGEKGAFMKDDVSLAGISSAGGNTKAMTAIRISPPAVPTMAAINAVPIAVRLSQAKVHSSIPAMPRKLPSAISIASGSPLRGGVKVLYRIHGTASVKGVGAGL